MRLCYQHPKKVVPMTGPGGSCPACNGRMGGQVVTTARLEALEGAREAKKLKGLARVRRAKKRKAQARAKPQPQPKQEEVEV